LHALIETAAFLKDDPALIDCEESACFQLGLLKVLRQQLPIYGFIGDEGAGKSTCINTIVTKHWQGYTFPTNTPADS